MGGLNVGPWQLREARAEDANELSRLAERTFREAFEADNQPADIDLHCSQSYRPQLQEAEIADPAMETLVVERAGKLIAYAQLHRTNQPACLQRPGMMELQRIYVDRRWHGSGLAQELMDKMVGRASELGAEALWLGVWEKNPRAIRFYERLGFVEEGAHEFVVGRDPQRDLVMVMPFARYRRGGPRGSEPPPGSDRSSW